MLDSNQNKLIVCKFYLIIHHLHARVQSLTCTTYGKYLRESIIVVPTPKSGILIMTYENTVNIERKNKYTIQFLKDESPLHNLFLQAIWTPPLKMKEMPTPLKKCLITKKSPHSLRGVESTL